MQAKQGSPLEQLVLLGRAVTQESLPNSKAFSSPFFSLDCVVACQWLVLLLS